MPESNIWHSAIVFDSTVTWQHCKESRTRRSEYRGDFCSTHKYIDRCSILWGIISLPKSWKCLWFRSVKLYSSGFQSGVTRSHWWKQIQFNTKVHTQWKLLSQKCSKRDSFICISAAKQIPSIHYLYRLSFGEARGISSWYWVGGVFTLDRSAVYRRADTRIGSLQLTPISITSLWIVGGSNQIKPTQTWQVHANLRTSVLWGHSAKPAEVTAVVIGFFAQLNIVNSETGLLSVSLDFLVH